MWKSVLLAVLTWILSAPVVAAALFFPVRILAGPHSSLLPAPLQAGGLLLGWLSVVVVPAWLALKVFRRFETARLASKTAVTICWPVLLAALATAAAVLADPAVVPSKIQIDGVVTPGEWAGARSEPLTGGGEVLLRRDGEKLYVAVTGPAKGYPSLCVGDAEHIRILHSSAALGSVAYTRVHGQWHRGEPFEWRLRDAPGPGASRSAEREAFEAEHGWISTASRAGAATREFRVTLRPGRQLLGVVFLSTDTMAAAYWPASMDDGCRDIELLRGDAPETLKLDPSHWYHVE